MLRDKEIQELKRLQKKYCDNDEIYRLIDLSAAMLERVILKLWIPYLNLDMI